MKLIKLIALAIVLLTVGACSHADKADGNGAFSDSEVNVGSLDSLCVDESAEDVVEGDVDPTDDVMSDDE